MKPKNRILYDKDDTKAFLGIIGIFLAIAAIVYYLASPSLRDFRRSIYGTLFEFVTVLIATIIYALPKTHKIPLIGKIVVILFPFAKLVAAIAPMGKFNLMVYYAYALLGAGVTAYYYIKKNKHIAGVSVCSLYSFVLFMTPSNPINTIGPETPFLIASFAISVVLTTIILLVIVSLPEKPKALKKTIAMPLAVLFLSFLFVFISVYTANFIFDSSEPTQEEYIVIEKSFSSHGKGVNRWYIEVENENKTMQIEVSSTNYEKISIGERVVLNLYEGAFSAPYYIYSHNK